MHQQLAGNGPKLRNTAMALESLALRQGETLPLPSETLKIEDSPGLYCLNKVEVKETVYGVEPDTETYWILSRTSSWDQAGPRTQGGSHLEPCV